MNFASLEAGWSRFPNVLLAEAGRQQDSVHLVSQGDTQSPRRQCCCPGRGIPGGLLPNSLPLAARCRQRPLSGRGMGGNSISPSSAPSPQAHAPKATNSSFQGGSPPPRSRDTGPWRTKSAAPLSAGSPCTSPAPGATGTCGRDPGSRTPVGVPRPPLWYPHPEPDVQSRGTERLQRIFTRVFTRARPASSKRANVERNLFSKQSEKL